MGDIIRRQIQKKRKIQKERQIQRRRFQRRLLNKKVAQDFIVKHNSKFAIFLRKKFEQHGYEKQRAAAIIDGVVEEIEAEIKQVKKRKIIYLSQPPPGVIICSKAIAK